jgi:beta-phosphoglucomutase-like phosphatase (HAD superfamily)
VTLRAVVFDFDGVIANSEPLHFRAFREVLGAVGVTLTEQDYYARYLGYNDVGAFEAVAAERGQTWNAERIDELVRVKAERMAELERDHCVLFPGAAAAIRRLSGGVALAIASGAIRAEIVRVLERERLADAFAVLVASEDTAASKPAPDPYLRAVSLLSEAHGGIRPDECVAIEDSRWGLESARAAGLRTIAVAHTYDARDLAGSADVVIPNLETLTLEFVRRIVQTTR